MARPQGSKYGYLAGTDTALPSMTAEALLCRQYLGWKRDNKHLQAGVAYLLQPENLPTWQGWDDFKGRGRDVYHWYYAAQTLHHMEGPSWDRWNRVMKPTLVRAQVKAGRERGSWDPDGDNGAPTAAASMSPASASTCWRSTTATCRSTPRACCGRGKGA